MLTDMGMGVNKLAQVITERITRQTIKPDVIELGTIQADMGLLIDRFPIPIPAGEYLIVDWQAKLHFPGFFFVGNGTAPVDEQGTPQPGATTSPLTKYEFLEKEVDQVHVEIKPDLKPGDRVLIAWVNDGTDPVVISKVVT